MLLKIKTQICRLNVKYIVCSCKKVQQWQMDLFISLSKDSAISSSDIVCFFYFVNLTEQKFNHSLLYSIDSNNNIYLYL